jgi:hypothetical protein
MEHEIKVLEVRQVNNEQVSYLLGCTCGDEHERSWHTLHIHLPDHEGVLEERKKVALARHEAMQKWKEKWMKP